MATNFKLGCIFLKCKIQLSFRDKAQNLRPGVMPPAPLGPTHFGSRFTSVKMFEKLGCQQNCTPDDNRQCPWNMSDLSRTSGSESLENILAICKITDIQYLSYLLPCNEPHQIQKPKATVIFHVHGFWVRNSEKTLWGWLVSAARVRGFTSQGWEIHIPGV